MYKTRGYLLCLSQFQQWVYSCLAGISVGQGTGFVSAHLGEREIDAICAKLPDISHTDIVSEIYTPSEILDILPDLEGTGDTAYFSDSVLMDDIYMSHSRHLTGVPPRHLSDYLLDEVTWQLLISTSSQVPVSELTELRATFTSPEFAIQAAQAELTATRLLVADPKVAGTYSYTDAGVALLKELPNLELKTARR